MKSVFFVAPLALAASLLSACAPTSQLQLSSGRVGCASSEIVIGDVASTRRSESWSATCRGQTFYCSGTDDFREVICRPATKAVAAAPVVAAPVVTAPVAAAPVAEATAPPAAASPAAETPAATLPAAATTEVPATAEPAAPAATAAEPAK